MVQYKYPLVLVISLMVCAPGESSALAIIGYV